jgi:hypothetical protein
MQNMQNHLNLRLDNVAAVAAASSVLICGCALQAPATTTPSRESVRPPKHDPASVRVRQPDEEPHLQHPSLAAADRAARSFLNGYVPFLYGHGAARLVQGASPTLRRELRRGWAAVTPEERRADPRLTRLELEAAGPHSASAAATIAVGRERVLVTITLRLAHSSWWVVGLGSQP